MWELDHKESWKVKKLCFWTVVLGKTLESPLDCKIKPVPPKGSVLKIHWKDWCWSWSSKNLTTWCEKSTPWKRPWCWERLKVRGEGDDRGWDGWMASRMWCLNRLWELVKDRKPGMLLTMGLQRVGHHWSTEVLSYYATHYGSPTPTPL